MTTELQLLLAKLEARLPELEWKMNALGGAISTKFASRGLFRSAFERDSNFYLDEIRGDLKALGAQKNRTSAYYLANKINQKINVLVQFCQIQGNKPKVNTKLQFGVNMINTRQQWLQTLEKDILMLKHQQQAMTKSLANLEKNSNIEASLALQQELGEVQRRLTLAQEAFNTATR